MSFTVRTHSRVCQTQQRDVSVAEPSARSWQAHARSRRARNLSSRASLSLVSRLATLSTFSEIVNFERWQALAHASLLATLSLSAIAVHEIVDFHRSRCLSHTRSLTLSLTHSLTLSLFRSLTLSLSQSLSHTHGGRRTRTRRCWRRSRSRRPLNSWRSKKSKYPKLLRTFSQLRPFEIIPGTNSPS